MPTKPLTFLIVDDEPDLREFVVLIVGSGYNSQFYEAGSVSEALDILKNDSITIDFIISDFNMRKGNGNILAEYAHEHLPKVPFLLITSDERRRHESILAQPMTGYFEKPVDSDALLKEVDRLLLLREGSLSTTQPSYMPISIRSLQRLNSTGHSLFIKLNEGHFVRVVAEGETFNEVSSQRFTDKDVHYLYLQKEDFTAIMEEFKNLVQNDLYLSALKAKKGEGLEISRTLQELVTTATKIFEWNDSIFALGNEGIRLMQNIIRHDDHLNEIFDWFSEDNHDDGINNGILLIYTLTAITRSLSLANPRSLDYLSMAAFLHDMTLSDHLIRNQRKFLKAHQLGIPANKQEVETIKNHAAKTVEILSSWPYCPKEVLRIIELHNLQPNDPEFPKDQTPKEVDFLAGVFIVALEVVQLFISHRSRETLLSELRAKANVFNSSPLTREPFAIALKRLAR